MTGGRRALLIGAGSQIAPFLSRRLAAIGWSGDALSRRAPPSHPPLDPAFEWSAFDVASSGRPRGAWEAVFSMLPLWLLPPLVPHLQGLRYLVAFSSTSVHTKAVSEDPAERELVGRLVGAERHLLALCHARGLACNLLRPTLVYGSGRDRNLSAIAGFIRRHGFFPVVYPGKGLRQPVHADDLATAAVSCLHRSSSQALALNLPGGETLTFRDMVKRVFVALERRPVIVPLPQSIVSFAGQGIRYLLPGGYSPALLKRMNEDFCFDVSPALRELGYRPRPLRLGVGDLGAVGLSTPTENAFVHRSRNPG